MADESTKTLPDQVDFKFEKDPSYRVVPVNGIWGGPTIRGDIRVELFYERQALPEHVGNSVSPNGDLGPEVHRSEPTNLFLRTVMVGIMLTPEQANSIGQWLKDQAAIVRGLKSATTDDTQEKQEIKTDASVH